MRVKRQHQAKPQENFPPLTLEVEKTVFGAWGLARHEEWGVIFVKDGLAGEQLEIKIYEKRRGVCFANILQILRASGERVKPLCPLYNECGGCDFMHLNIDAQRKAKQEWTVENFKRFAQYPLESTPAIYGLEPFHYRRRFQFHHHITRQRESKDTSCIGLKRAHSREVIPVSDCPIAHEKINAFLKENALGKKLSPKHYPKRFYSLAADYDLLVGNDRKVGDIKLNYHSYQANYRIKNPLFFQSNPAVFAKLIEEILEFAPNEGLAIDFYAGVGFFSVPLLQHGLSVFAVEESPDVDSLIHHNVAENVTLKEDQFFQFYNETVEQFEGDEERESVDYIIADPPRTGLSEEARQKIIGIRPKKFSYISCQSDILARDTKFLLANGAKLHHLSLFDTAPQTSHYESLAHFTFDSEG